MSRYIVDLQVERPDAEINQIATNYLVGEGFEYVSYKGEMLWKKGKGLLTAPQFIQVFYNQGQVQIQAWMKTALLPGVYVGESGVNGVWGFAVKKMLKDRVDMLCRVLTQQSPQP